MPAEPKENEKKASGMKKISEIINNFRYWLWQKLPYLVVTTLIILLLIIYFWQNIVITIYAGEAGVMYRRFFGTVTDYVYQEGLHIIPPWDTMNIYNVRIQTTLHDFDIFISKRGHAFTNPVNRLIVGDVGFGCC